MFGPLTKRGSVSRRRLPAMAASGIAAAGLSVGVFMTSPALAADNHGAHPAHPAKGGPDQAAGAPEGGHGSASGPQSNSATQPASSGPAGAAATPAASGGNGGKPDGPKPPKPGKSHPGPSADANAGAGSNPAPAANADGGHGAQANTGPAAGTAGPAPDAKAAPAGDKAKAPKDPPAKAAKTPPAGKGQKTPPPGKGPKAGPTATGGCSEDSFLGSATPASGSNVAPGSRIGATYSDEKVISSTLPPTLTLTGPGVDTQLQIDTFAPAKTVLLTAQLPTTGLSSGTYVATLKAWDGDQNKAGGDCGVATWSFVVTAPNPPPVNPTPPVIPTPPVNPTPPVSPTPPVNPPSTPPAAPTVPTQVLGVTLTPPTTVPAAPTANAAPGPLAFTGDETRVLSEAGLLLVAAGSAMIGRSQRRRFGRSKKR